MEAILQKLSLREMKKGEIAIENGEKGKEFFIIMGGSVSILLPK